MIFNNFKNFFKNILYSLINFSLILLGISLASLFFLLVVSNILKMQNSEFLFVMRDYLTNKLANTTFVEIFALDILKEIFIDIINLGYKYQLNLDLYFFLIGVVSISIVFASYKGSIAIVDHLHKRKFRNKYTKRGFASFIPKAIIGLASSLLITVILLISGGNAATTYLVYLIIDSIKLLFVTYYVYFGGIRFSKFITNKNMMKIFGLYLFSQSFFVLLAMLIWKRVPIMSIVIILPLLAYSTTNVRYTTTEYFKNKIRVTRWNKKYPKEMKN